MSESAFLAKSMEQKFLDRPGYIDVDFYEDGGVWRWTGGPVAVVHESHIQELLELATENALPWQITIVGKVDNYFYLRKGSEIPCWLERLMN